MPSFSLPRSRESGGTRLAIVDDVGASSSQTGPSQTVDPTQYQQQHYQDQAYQPEFQQGYEYH